MDKILRTVRESFREKAAVGIQDSDETIQESLHVHVLSEKAVGNPECKAMLRRKKK